MVEITVLVAGGLHVEMLVWVLVVVNPDVTVRTEGGEYVTIETEIEVTTEVRIVVIRLVDTEVWIENDGVAAGTGDAGVECAKRPVAARTAMGTNMAARSRTIQSRRPAIDPQHARRYNLSTGDSVARYGNGAVFVSGSTMYIGWMFGAISAEALEV
jgi:hypothetical protein